MAAVTTVEMGEIASERTPGRRLEACGLGACVGLCLYEPLAQAAVLVHVVLPQTLPALTGRPATAPLPGKCADTAVKHALAEIVRLGGQVQLLRAALVGGAQIFTPANIGTGDAASLSRLEIGQRTVRRLQEELERAGIPVCAEETGGHGGRTVTLEAGTGAVWVRPLGLPERLLVSLGCPPVSAEFSLPAPPSRRSYPDRAGLGAYGN